MVRITVWPEEKPLDMKEGKPWHQCREPEMAEFLANSSLGKMADKGLESANTRFVHIHSRHVFLPTGLIQRYHCSRNYTRK